MITSTSGKQLKRIAKLNKKTGFRREEGVFVAEGAKMFTEAPKEWIEKVYVSESFCQNSGTPPEHMFQGCDWEMVSDIPFAAACDTKTPQGLLMTVRIPTYTLKDLVKKDRDHAPGLLLIENIQDPGNLGTMLRAAEGAGIDGIIMSEDTVDLFHPKTIRSTMGTVYRMPYVVTASLVDTIKELQGYGICIYAAQLEGSMLYDEPDYRQGFGFLVGNESRGLRPETAAAAMQKVRIPMEGRLESLNAAMAATILMYESSRQRRQKSGK